jgi:pimeloyl-ACP methyl ester carboxylesterase
MTATVSADTPEVCEVVLHGHRVSYRLAGQGPVVLLLHGIAGSSQTWVETMAALADEYTVLAPDLLGHGGSAKPRGDYSLGAYASLVRDLLTSLGLERATVVGHSLGGGVAIQFAYQFPDRCERPRARLQRRARPAGAPVAPRRSAAGQRVGDAAAVRRAGWARRRSGRRSAQQDRAAGGPRGHFPHRSEPARFVDSLRAFMQETAPAEFDGQRWREMLREGE